MRTRKAKNSRTLIRFAGIFLAVLLLVSVLPVSAMAADTESGEPEAPLETAGLPQETDSTTAPSSEAVPSSEDTALPVSAPESEPESETAPATEADPADTPEEEDGDSEETYVAWIGDLGYPSLEAAIEAAEDGATIQLAAGTFSAYRGMFGSYQAEDGTNKSLTFVGAGTGETTWIVGPEVPRPGYVGEYDGDYSFDGSEYITFKNMTLQYGQKFYLGFIRVKNFAVKNCVVNGQITYGGTLTATYENTVFNAPANDYSFFLCDPTVSMSFSGCTFNGDGKFVNVYKDYNAGAYDVTVNFSGCTVNSTKPNKSVLNIKDNNNTYIVNISGVNTVTGLEPNETTCSKLFQVEVTSEDQAQYATVSIDGVTVWTNGKMVNHAIDTANDKYTDGYKDDAFTVTYSEWEDQGDAYTRTRTTVCDYCGYTEEETEILHKYTVSYDLNGGVAADGEDYAAQTVIEGSEVTAKAAPSRDGYVFKGWNTQADGQGTAYAAGAVFAVSEADVTLYAQWEEIVYYTVTYTDGVDGTTIFADQVYSGLVSGDKTPAFGGTPTRSGYTFKGWKPSVAETVTGDAVYTAQWEALSSSSAPKTGDSSSLALWLTLMLAAGTGAAGTVLCRKKRSAEK